MPGMNAQGVGGSEGEQENDTRNLLEFKTKLKDLYSCSVFSSVGFIGAGHQKQKSQY